MVLEMNRFGMRAWHISYTNVVETGDYPRTYCRVRRRKEAHHESIAYVAPPNVGSPRKDMFGHPNRLLPHN